MNYYIQGCAAKADQIKAAFEKLGYEPYCWTFETEFYFTVDCTKTVQIVSSSSKLINIIKTHPDYKELELPVEPKFKKGDWIACDADSFTLSIKSVKDGNYYFHQGASLPIKDIDEHYHLWTIADAKDGDVLVTTKIRSCPFIYRKTDIENNLAHYYAGIDGNGDFSEGCLKGTLYHFGLVSDVIPATKEQRDLLFKKMREAGYEWDTDKKELCKTIDEPIFKVGDEIFRPACNEYFKIKDIEKDNGTVWYVTTRTRITYNDGRTGGIIRINARYQNEYNIAPKPHYDIKNFKPFDKVLVRDGDLGLWKCDIFSDYYDNFYCFRGTWEQCIPFNDDTKHLLGTTDMPDEMYINW